MTKEKIGIVLGVAFIGYTFGFYGGLRSRIAPIVTVVNELRECIPTDIPRSQLQAYCGITEPTCKPTIKWLTPMCDACETCEDCSPLLENLKNSYESYVPKKEEKKGLDAIPNVYRDSKHIY